MRKGEQQRHLVKIFIREMNNMQKFDFNGQNFAESAVSPFLELGAYEALWNEARASFKSIANKFENNLGSLPSQLVDPNNLEKCALQVHEILTKSGINSYGVLINGVGEYPTKLRDAEYPVELLYYQGWLELLHSPKSVAIVGTRNPTENGKKRTCQLVRNLVQDKITIVSGLADGIDTVAHETAIEAGGDTIAVLGTPLSQSYPRKNEALQQEIAKNHLLVSQVPVLRYQAKSNPVAHKHFFPARNVTMSALTDATVIIEAGKTSGTLIQARAALKQGRKLFILNSCFENPQLTWPTEFQERGAIRVKDYGDIKEHINA